MAFSEAFWANNEATWDAGLRCRTDLGLLENLRRISRYECKVRQTWSPEEADRELSDATYLECWQAQLAGQAGRN